MRPYRTNTPPLSSRSSDPRGDEDLLVPFAVVWLFCALRVVSALVRSEVFGVSATLALLVVILLPILALERAMRHALRMRGR